mmetsp:Transcript_13004/g.29599  ORF Transcript_13004/g.29599 Transcript_13004/m.29599 type:complete len:228 (+) Transcript_13004:296-979(+)
MCPVVLRLDQHCWWSVLRHVRCRGARDGLVDRRLSYTAPWVHHDREVRTARLVVRCVDAWIGALLPRHVEVTCELATGAEADEADLRLVEARNSAAARHLPHHAHGALRVHQWRRTKRQPVPPRDAVLQDKGRDTDRVEPGGDVGALIVYAEEIVSSARCHDHGGVRVRHQVRHDGRHRHVQHRPVFALGNVNAWCLALCGLGANGAGPLIRHLSWPQRDSRGSGEA